MRLFLNMSHSICVSTLCTRHTTRTWSVHQVKTPPKRFKGFIKNESIESIEQKSGVIALGRCWKGLGGYKRFILPERSVILSHVAKQLNHTIRWKHFPVVYIKKKQQSTFRAANVDYKCGSVRVSRDTDRVFYIISSVHESFTDSSLNGKKIFTHVSEDTTQPKAHSYQQHAG